MYDVEGGAWYAPIFHQMWKSVYGTLVNFVHVIHFMDVSWSYACSAIQVCLTEIQFNCRLAFGLCLLNSNLKWTRFWSFSWWFVSLKRVYSTYSLLLVVCWMCKSEKMRFMIAISVQFQFDLGNILNRFGNVENTAAFLLRAPTQPNKTKPIAIWFITRQGIRTMLGPWRTIKYSNIYNIFS